MRKHSLESIPERAVSNFWKYVRSGPFDDCWNWNGGKYPSGYGRINITFSRCVSRQEYAHRVSYVIHKGPIPAGLVVMHRCDNPSCVNPQHLSLGTQRDNMKQRDERGRDRYSRGHFPPRLCDGNADARIANLYISGMSMTEVATTVGFSLSTVRESLLRTQTPTRATGFRTGISFPKEYQWTRKAPAPPRGESVFRGVCREGDKWRAKIQTNGKKIHVGTFSTEELAARAYDEYAKRLHGDFARLNFPEEAGREAA